MNPFEMVVAIIVIVTIGSVLKARYGIHKDKHGNEIFRGGDMSSTAASRKKLVSWFNSASTT